MTTNLFLNVQSYIYQQSYFMQLCRFFYSYQYLVFAILEPYFMDKFIFIFKRELCLSYQLRFKNVMINVCHVTVLSWCLCGHMYSKFNGVFPLPIRSTRSSRSPKFPD